MQFKKARIAIPSLIVLVAVAAGGAQLWAQHDARHRVDETLASLPMGATGRYDSLGYNVFTQTLRLNGLSIARDDTPLIAADHLVMHHLSGNGQTETPYHAEAVSLTNLNIWRNGHRVKIGTVNARNVAILAPGVPAPAGTPSWVIAPAEGTPVSVGMIQANAISSDQGTSIAALSAGGYQAGQLREVSLVSYRDADGNAVESAGATGIDLGGLDRVFNVARYTPDAPGWTTPRPLIGHLDIANLTTKGESGDSHLDHLTLDGVAGRPFAAAPTPEALKTPAFARDAASAIAIGNGTLLNLTVSDTRRNSSATLDHLAITGYRDGALGRFTLGHLTVAENGKTIASLGHFEISGLNATALLHAAPDASMQDLMVAAQNGGVKLSSLSTAALSYPLTSGGVITLKSLQESIAYGTLIQSSFAMDGLGIPATATPQLEQLLQPLGIDTLTLSLKEAGSFDPASGDTTVDHALLDAAGLANVSLSGTFTGLPRSLPANGDVASALTQVGIGSFTLTFTDASLVQRVIASLAQRSGKTAAQIADGARAAAAFFAAAVVPQQSDAGTQVANFIGNPKTLTLTASPVAPVPLSSF
ncbi:MAG TPA: hypothetical protein VHX12_09180, partial [Acidisoma sp.]|nr:hypothetical protein [Acidisoma sp.]